MMSGPTPLPIACDLGALSSGQRARERALLAEFKDIFRDARETDRGYSVVVPADGGLITLQIYGRPGTKSFLRSEFFA